MKTFSGNQDQLLNALDELTRRGSQVSQGICEAAIAEIKRLEGKREDASFLIGLLENGPAPVASDARKWFRDERILDTGKTA